MKSSIRNLEIDPIREELGSTIEGTQILSAQTGRISVNSVTEQLRRLDGLGSGDVIFATDNLNCILPPELIMPDEERRSSLLQYYETASYNDFVYSLHEWIDKNIESLEDDERTGDFEQYNLQLSRTTIDINLITSLLYEREELQQDDTIGSRETDDTPEWIAELKGHVLDIVDEFQALHPDKDFNEFRPGSAKALNELLAYYNERVHQQDSVPAVKKMISRVRNQLTEVLDSSKTIRAFGGKEITSQIKKILETQPIVVSDPLRELDLFLNSKSVEPMGWFNSSDRLVYIDIYTATRHYDVPEHMYFGILSTVTHELLHAATSNVYRLQWNKIVSHHQWPQFLLEAMVEKAALFLAVDAIGQEGIKLIEKSVGNYPIGRYENRFRTVCSDNPTEVMAPQRTKMARFFTGSSYKDYRLLLDTLMEKADWEAAGISRSVADKLLIKAFFSRTNDLPDQDQKHRKEFLHSLSTATQPGILQKIDELVRIGGTDLALDVLESPNFDIHDKEGLKVPASPRLATRLEMANMEYVTALNRIAYFKKHENDNDGVGVPTSLTDYYKSQIETLKEDSGQFEMLLLAKVALVKILRSKHGKRHRSYNERDALYSALFGKTPDSDYHSVEVDDIEVHEAAYQHWLRTRE